MNKVFESISLSKTEIADAAQGLTQFLYDANGNLVEVRKEKRGRLDF